MADPKSYYQFRGDAMEKATPNLVMIVADDDGKIDFRGSRVLPNSVIYSLLFPFGFGIPRRITNPDLVPDEGIDRKIWQMIDDPLEYITIRKLGLSDDRNSKIIFLGIKYYRSQESGKGGYLLYMSDKQVDILTRTDIEHVHLGTRQ